MKVLNPRLLLVSSVLALSAAAVAGAAGGGLPPVAVEFPLDIADLGTAIAVAGGSILAVAFGIGLGFKMIKKLKARLASSV